MFPFRVLLSLCSSESLQGLVAATTTTLSFQSPTTTSVLVCPKFPLVPPPCAPVAFPPVSTPELPARGCRLVGNGGGTTWASGWDWLLTASSCSKELPLWRLLSWSRKQLVAGVDRRALMGNSLAARQCLSWYVRPDMRLLTDPMAVSVPQGPRGCGSEEEWDDSGWHCWTSRAGFGWSVTGSA